MSEKVMFKFGVQSGTIAQLGFGVTDIDRAIDIYVDQLHIGPWQYTPDFAPGGGTFRSQPGQPSKKTNAMAWAGNYFIELIQQFSDEPSCVKEHGDSFGYGLNHYGFFYAMNGEYDKKIAELTACGYEEVFSGITPPGSRSIYLGPKNREDVDLLAHNLGVGYIELVELVPADEDMWYNIYLEAKNWDGKTRYTRKNSNILLATAE